MFFDLIKNLYYKYNSDIEINTNLCITLTKWLGQDRDNASILTKVAKYIFDLEPKHYYYLLFLNIKKKQKLPYFKKVGKKEIKINKEMEEIKRIFQWSDRELLLHRKIL